ncbi:MAG: hypothetical protein HY252_17855, partial [Sphingobacteriales bacterium]|nr:hypothetical protein [Sphingobacteriales bacterium]
WKEDKVAPVITTDGKGGDLGCNPTADAINAALGGATDNDHCDGTVQVAVSNSEVTGDCNKSQTRTFTATDACGNSASTSVTVTWKEDKVAPVFDNVPADATIDCGTAYPEVPVVTATDNCDGKITAKYEGQTDLTAGDCGEYFFFRNWSVTDACGNSTTAQQKITIKAGTPIFTPESLPGDETVECNSGNPPANPQATVCTPNGPIPADVTGPVNSDTTVVDKCTYTYLQTWTAVYPGLPNCPQPPSAQYTRTVTVTDTQKPTISGLPTETTVTIKCNQQLPAPPEVTATDICDPKPSVVYQQTGPVAKNCVDGIKESYTRTWYAVDACGNKTETFTQTINVLCCEAFCTYTQGYYGNPGGKSCDGTTGGLSTRQLINKSLNAWTSNGSTDWIIGKPGRGIVITNADADWIIKYLPGGGASKALKPGDCDISDPLCMKNNLRNGRINNTLLAQTLTLGLNMGIKGTLGSLQLKGGMYLNTADLAGGCGTTAIKPCQYDVYGNVTYSPYHSYMLPANVLNYLSGIGKANVSGLFELANKLLGGDAVPAGLTLSDVASAEDILNNAFDECKAFAGWSAQPATCPKPLLGRAISPVTMVTTQQLTVRAYPNPYDENITFVINSPESGRGKLNLFNMKGEQVSTVFDGNVEANKTLTVTYKVPPLHRTSLVYHFQIGKKIETGKLVRPN